MNALDPYLTFQLQQGVLDDQAAHQERVERFLPPTDEQVQKELERRKEARDGKVRR